jgi:(Z)-2-((N-methylformamido)methylene)-5-hydroxybutyrolactone dehydrogenase
MSASAVPALTHWIEGAGTAGTTGETLPSIDPANGQVLYTIPRGDHHDVDRAVAAAERALAGPWSRFTGHQRARALRRLAALIEARADELAVLEARDNGKVLRENAGQIASLPETIEYVSGWADKLHGESLRLDGAPYQVTTRREPVGVVAAVVPWNSPLSLTIFKVAPALAAGCTVVVKPSEHTSRTALELARMCAEADIPDGVVNVVTGLGGEVGSPLVRDPRVAKVSFTGSTATGVRIAQESAPNVTRLMLELGGKSANIVLADADLEAATTGALAGIFAAAGQTCIAGSRLLVHRAVHDELVARVGERARAIRVGDPLLPETEMGPVAFHAQMEKVLGFLGSAAAEGARVVAGGGRLLDGALADGCFVAPSVLADVRNTMAVAREEIFGPVLSRDRLRR